MKKVLIADDDVLVRKSTRIILQKAGFEIEEAHDGKTALQRLREENFYLLVTDIIMPNKDGIETIVEARRKYPKLYILAMSGGGRMGNTDFLELALSMGANAEIKKPFEASGLSLLCR